ncbi:hypothetical protein [Sphingomonas sp. PvP055]|uniref:hypothetical protein n=1 Tax=Sphingomonas sp. PvP055 TaxID=3156391 RepID=UPI00339B823E
MGAQVMGARPNGAANTSFFFLRVLAPLRDQDFLTQSRKAAKKVFKAAVAAGAAA